MSKESIPSGAPLPWHWGADATNPEAWPKLPGDHSTLKYADIGLYDAVNRPILPLRTDHYVIEWDGGAVNQQVIAYIKKACNAYPDLMAGLRSLANAAGSLRAFELELREIIGHTNYQILEDRIEQADALLAKTKGV